MTPTCPFPPAELLYALEARLDRCIDMISDLSMWSERGIDPLVLAQVRDVRKGLIEAQWWIAHHFVAYSKAMEAAEPSPPTALNLDLGTDPHPNAPERTGELPTGIGLTYGQTGGES